MTSINQDFQAFLAQRAQELAGTKTTAQTAFEQQEKRAAEGAEVFTGLFAELDAQTHQEPAPVKKFTGDPAENAFNQLFGL
jgi:hypothetical protein